jgi:acetylornithine deacetylase/succinyl-diaminopimelate desuccinylase-like protein
MEHSQSYPLNIKLCIEGEEEIGSMGLSQILMEKKAQLKADYLAVVDSGIQDPKIPSLTLGMRGIITLDVEVKGSEIDLHSGQHGGIVPNPLHMLVQLLAKLRNEEGKIMIPGFYEGVETLSSEKFAVLSFNFDKQEYYKQTGAFCVGGEREYPPLQRAHIRPTVEINGIQGGYMGQGFKTVIPAIAKAKISCRLVPQQDPARISELITSYLTTNAPVGVKISVHIHEGKGKPIRISADARIVKAFSKALEEVFGKTCQYGYSGGSIPIVSELVDACGGEVVILGLGLNTDRIHAPNEHFSLDRIEKGIVMVARAIDILSKL